MQQQGSQEWLQARCGVITASRFHDVLAVSKRDGGPLKARLNYASEIIVERLSGAPMTTPNNYATQWGNDCEPAARLAYEIKTGSAIKEVGLLRNSIAGASSDGLLTNNGGIEIKCPVNAVNHLNTIFYGMPEEHVAQVQGQMWVAELDWIDFVSFDPRMPHHLKLYIERITRDNDYIAKLESEVIAFSSEIDLLISKLPTSPASVDESESID